MTLDPVKDAAKIRGLRALDALVDEVMARYHARLKAERAAPSVLIRQFDGPQTPEALDLLAGAYALDKDKVAS